MAGLASESGRRGPPRARGRRERRPPYLRRQRLQTPPSSFTCGRYWVREFLGEGGKKRVLLAHDTTLERDVAFAPVRTGWLDDVGRQRVQREAQAGAPHRRAEGVAVVAIHNC